MKADNISCFDFATRWFTMKLYGDRINKIRARSKRIKEWGLRNRSYKKRRASSLSYDPVYSLFSDILNGDLPIIGRSEKNQIRVYPLNRNSVSMGGRPLSYASRNTSAI